MTDLVCRLVVAMFIVAAFCLALAGLSASKSRAHELIPPTAEEAEDIKQWIPVTCCWSNNCCFKIKATDLTPLSRDEYRVNVTGQVVRRTDWSRDGQTWRCTCDPQDGKWVAHLHANTRCIFPAATGY